MSRINFWHDICISKKHKKTLKMETNKFEGIMVTSLVRSQNKLWDKYLKAQSETKKNKVLAEIHLITEILKEKGCNTFGDAESMMIQENI